MTAAPTDAERLQMDNQHWILDDKGEPIPADLFTWAHWFENNQTRTLKHDKPTPDVLVSTVFLGLDHGFGPPGSAPVLWETMIFGGPHDGYQDRYTSRLDALAGHQVALQLAISDKPSDETSHV